MKRTILLLCGCMLAASGFAEPEKLTLERALELARINSPELKAARLSTQAATEAVYAAGRWKNPNLEFEAEGIGGDLDGFNETEYTLGLSQTFQRGGKQKYARQVAESAIGVAFKAEAEKELELLAAVREAFIEVVAQQEIGTVRSEQEELSRAFLKVAKMKYEAGGASEMEVVQAELALEETLLAQTCCFGDLEAARINLASLVGIPEKEMGKLAADSYYVLEEIAPAVLPDTHPSLQRMDAQIKTVQAQARQAKAKDAADITLAAGYKYEAGPDVNTFLVGAKMPLNFVRAGKAEHAAVLQQAEALQAGQDELRRFYQQQLSMLIAQYKGARMETELTHGRLIPKAEKAYELTQTGYRAGRFSWLELIAAQQHLAEIRVRHIEALQSAHLLRAQISKFMEEGI